MTASLPTVRLPRTFGNSFWTADYRRGFTRLLVQLETGTSESEQLVSLAASRAAAERSYAAALAPLPLHGEGFERDDPGSLGRAFHALGAVAVADAARARRLAASLDELIVRPFTEWSNGHAWRVDNARRVVEKHLVEYETRLENVRARKVSCDASRHEADEAQNEADFIGAESVPVATLPPIDDGQSEDGHLEDDDEALVGRSGATGGALSRAFTKRAAGLGRALTVRLRDTLTPPPADASDSLDTLDGSEKTGDVSSALEWSRSRLTSLLNGAAGTGEKREVVTRREAEEQEELYRKAIRDLDTTRCALEQTLSENFVYLQKIETDRTAALATVLKAFVGLLKKAGGSNEALDSAAAVVELVRPEAAIAAIIESHRTSAAFIPATLSFQSPFSEPPPARFGLDLARWDETKPLVAGLVVPPVFSLLLDHLKQAKAVDKTRTAFILEAPLSAIHHLRSTLNDASDLGEVDLERYDLVVVGGALKYWLLELNPPLFPHSTYDPLKVLYPRGGTEVAGKDEAMEKVLLSLPTVHFELLRLLMAHCRSLVADGDETYEAKLALSLQYCLCRPATFTSLNMDDRFPTLLFLDLLRQPELFDSVVKLSVGRQERYKPRRQRTRPTDNRRFRTSIGAEGAPLPAPPPAESVEEPTSQEPTSQEPTSQEPTSQEPTSQELTSQVTASTPVESAPPIAAVETPVVATEPPSVESSPMINDPSTSTAELLSTNSSPIAAAAVLPAEEAASGQPARNLSRSKRISMVRGPRAPGGRGGAKTEEETAEGTAEE